MTKIEINMKWYKRVNWKSEMKNIIKNEMKIEIKNKMK